MKEAFERIQKRLEKLLGDTNFEKATREVNESYYEGLAYAYGEALSIVSEVEAEYINKSTEHINKSGDCSSGWIPCDSGQMPSSHESRKVWITIVYPSCRCTRKAVWNGWCFEWENGKYVDTNAHKIAAWKPYHAPEPYKPTND